MKKYLAMFTMILVLVSLTACGSDDDSYNSDWQGSIESSQGVQIEGVESGEVFASYSEDSEIDAF